MPGPSEQEEGPPDVTGNPHLRTVVVPRNANPSGDIFGGWTLSQVDLAGGTSAAERSGRRVATVAIEAMTFLRPVAVGNEVSCSCALAATSLKVRIETWARARAGQGAAKVTEGVFSLKAIDDEGRSRKLPPGAGR